ncbi:hypothetical protein HYW84_01075 [Candidatus Peregrinibacteria bacterium]|nr:hypothetical protein [Candidatus Peregrinibacteria bacterium]
MTHFPCHDRGIGGALRVVLSLMLAVCMMLPVSATGSSWNPTFLVSTEAFQTIDDIDTAANVQLRFGQTLNEKLLYDRANVRFKFTRGLFISGGLTVTGATILNVGNSTAAPDAGIALEVIGTASGDVLHAQRRLESSGSLAVFGYGKFDGGTLFIDSLNNKVGVNNLVPKTDLEVIGTMSGGNLTVTGLKSCDTIDTNGNGVLACGTDAGGGAGLTQTDADARYVNIAGDTMTGGLMIRNGGGFNASGALLTNSDATINSDRGAADAVLTFGNATLNQTIKFLNTSQRFQFSSNVSVLGNLSGATLNVNSLQNCDTIDTDAAGRLACGTDAGGGVGMTIADGDARYVRTAGGTMTGSLIVNGTTANLVKTTTGTANSTDFSLAGSTLTNVTSTNDLVTINDGTVPASGAGTMSTSTVTTSVAVGAGGHTILREDGKYIIIHGGAALTGSVWDGSTTGAMSASPTAPSTSAIGAGAISLKRPDGRYLVINAGGSLGTTSLFDPRGITATAAGPAVCGAGATTTGTNAFLRNDGKYVILCGGLTAWGVYDPTANTYTAGTAVGVAFNAGAHAIMRDNGTFLVFAGGNVTTHWLYNPFTNTMTLNPITTSPPTITTGAFSLRRKDGKFLVIGGAINTSSIYDPTEGATNGGAGTMTAQSGVGFGPTVALADGAQAVWRQDGKMLLIIGAGSTVTNIVDPSVTTSSQFMAGPTLAGAIGAGFHMFLRPNGQYQLIRGGATTTTDTYDMGFIIGGNTSGTQLASYETECMTATSLNASSRLFWNINQEGYVTFQAKTGNGACSGNYKDILNSGDLIGAANGDNRVQVKVFFKRQFPNFADQEWKLRRGLGQTLYRRVNPDPSLYDFTVDNSTMVHRTQFEFGNNANPSGPIAINIVNDKDKQIAISLAAGVGYGTTINAANPQLYNGAWGTHTVLTTSATAGTVVMRRPDGKFIVISGNTATANAQVYDPVAQTFTALGTTPAAGTGLGALAFKRPDGKFLIVLGNATTTTSIFDPIANTFTAGPALTAAAGRGALVIPLPSGRVLILHGNFTNTSSIYDPFQNTMVAGPTPSAVIGGGAMAIPRPNGTYFVVLGIATEACTALNTTTNNFDPYTMQFVATGSPAITTGVGPGAFAFQRGDGQWVIVHGGGTVTTCAGVTRTQIYNPFTNKSVVGPVLSAAAQHGAHAIPRPDGTWLVVHGGALATTSIYMEKAGAFTADGASNIGVFVAGPALVTAASAGAISFQRDDGKFVTLIGNATTTTHQYDAGWVDRGMYKSEQLNLTDLDSASTLSWSGSPDLTGISAEVRTATSQLGLQTVSSRDVPYPGARINPGASETWIRVHFNFKRTFPSYSGIFTDVWYNGGSSNLCTQRTVPTPTLTEFSINKDKDLVSLKSDSRSVFRVNSNGDIYTGPTSSILTGGADVAERYSSDQELNPGELVAIDRANDHGVIRSATPYQDDVLGVVSGNPGVVTGADTANSHPIALIGRVPANVTTENGAIRAGDRLTASGIPGYAMKATKAARVVGMALQTLDPESLRPCTANPRFQCGVVMMFVDLSDWPGEAQ